MGYYKVVGSQPIHVEDDVYQPGDEFDADLPQDLEEFLVGSGSLEMDPEKQPDPPEPEPEPEVTQGP